MALSELNVTLHGAFRKYRREIEFELSGHPGREDPVKNKAALAVIELLGLGMFGVDRCYMGQCCLGTTKGLLLGGFGIWCILDFIVVIFNCIACSKDIHVLGFWAKFQKDTVMPAFVLTIILLCIPCFPFPTGFTGGATVRSRDTSSPRDSIAAASARAAAAAAGRQQAPSVSKA
jgi:hypothetical protein